MRLKRWRHLWTVTELRSNWFNCRMVGGVLGVGFFFICDFVFAYKHFVGFWPQYQLHNSDWALCSQMCVACTCFMKIWIHNVKRFEYFYNVIVLKSELFRFITRQSRHWNRNVFFSYFVVDFRLKQNYWWSVIKNYFFLNCFFQYLRINCKPRED